MNSLTVTPSKQGLSQRLTAGQAPESKLLTAIVRAVGLWGLPVLAVYALARSLASAFLAPLWFDELLMREVCRQGSLAGIWKALKAGLDGQPPLYYVIERAAASLTPNEQLGYRLPSILGVLCALVFLYVFVRRNTRAIPALACSSLLLVTPLFTQHAAEARPYCLVAGCIAFAMVCYQRVPALRWVLGLFVSLFLACSFHYYAALFVGPFLAAEVVYVWASRKVRYGVWLALIAAPAPIAVAWPLLARLRAAYGQHFVFQGVALNGVTKAYGSYFRVESPWGTALVGILALTLAVGLCRDTALLREMKESRAADISQQALLLMLILVPLAGYLSSKIGHVPFVDRYFLPVVLGIAAGIGRLLGRVNWKTEAVCVLAILLAVGSQELGVWSSRMRVFNAPGAQINLVSHLSASVHHEDLPVVISDVGAYVEFWNYAPSALRNNVFGLDDPANAAIYAGTDTPERLAIVLRSYEPVAVQDFAAFAAAHASFLLVSNGSQFDWWPARLTRDGDRLQLLAVQGPIQDLLGRTDSRPCVTTGWPALTGYYALRGKRYTLGPLKSAGFACNRESGIASSGPRFANDAQR